MTLPVSTVWLYGLCFFAGLIFQSVLPRNIRLAVYPMSFILGFLGVRTQMYYLLAFNLGMISWAAVGRYWHCVAIEAVALLLGIALVSFV
ncbi:MAG: hypothetical protein NT016_00330 [Candidatus Aenigmarchaeota archaeon]|nr:hypothetical protein [Candidatus Aenigmarchaeota archaeon]